MATQRNQSKDSVLSSNSSTTNASQINSLRAGTPTKSHTYKSSQDTTASSTAAVASSSNAALPDPTSLIRAANGSPEAAIQKLLKERQTINQRNEQLWRLVEKQRAMILGLNSDLERFAKDKERYKRKLKEKEKEKEHAAVPTTPSVGAIAAMTTETRSPRSLGHASQTSASATQGPIPSLPSPKEVPQFSHTVHSPGGSLQKDRNGSSPPARIFRLEEPSKEQPTSENPSSPQDSRRKATPAPLDLSRPHATAPTTQRAIKDEDSGSEYEQVVSNKLSPKTSPVERGRLRSREDDDRQREAIARKELEEEEEAARSRSAKPKTSKTSSNSRTDVLNPEDDAQSMPRDSDFPAGLIPGAIGLPSSPRSNLLGGIQSPLLPTSNTSVAAAINSQLNARHATENSQRTFNPLKSPGLPMSPRPGDRPAGAAVPRTPNTPGQFSPRQGLPFSPRAPKQPIPLPRNDLLALNSPHLARAEAYHQQSSHETSMAERVQPRAAIDTERPSLNHTNSSEYGEVYKGFVSEQYPNLLLPPNALPLINAKVYSSRLRPSRNSYMASKQSEDNPIFTLAIYSRSDNKQLWRVEKTILAMPILDQSLRAVSDFSAKIPDRNLFSGHAPAKIDARTESLNKYFDTMLDTPLDDVGAMIVCEFFSTDVIPPKYTVPRSGNDYQSASASATTPILLHRKEGYLTKRGKNFGGWKARFFVLDGSDLNYYDSPGGSIAGTIKLKNAQIGKQSPGPSDGEPEDQYRHTLLILEPKRKDSSQKIRHILCAESDQERDSWVDAMLQRTDLHSDEEVSPDQPRSSTKGSGSPRFESVSYEKTVSAGSPKMVSSFKFPNGPSYSPPVSPTSPSSANAISSIGHPSISSPVAGGFIQNAEAWGNKSAKEKESKKRGIFGFKRHGSADLPSPRDLVQSDGREQHISERRIGSRPVFGLPLAEAAEYCCPVDVDICLPAVVYRCIEYLEAKGATREEGIFRLSGSNNVIQALQDRFNADGDVKLLDDEQYHDINAVAGVLKRYLTALPAPVLTRELHIDFLKVLELEDQSQRLPAFNILIHRLPEANFELLSTLSRFLIEIVSNSEYNKMNVRNIGILFSPTLNVPAPLISLFITDYDAMFGAPLSPSEAVMIAPVMEQLHVPQYTTSLTPDDIRSPRKQMFTDLPTPAYNQTSFAGLNVMNLAGHKSALTGPGYGNAFYQLQAAGMMSPVSPGMPQKDVRALYDTGYAQQDSGYHQQQQTPLITQVPESAGAGYGNFGSLNAALAPSTQQSRSAPTTSPTTATTSSPPHTALPAMTDSRKSSSASASSSSFSFGSVDSKDAMTSAAALKKARRESSLLGPGTAVGLSGQRKGSMQRLREVAGSLKSTEDE